MATYVAPTFKPEPVKVTRTISAGPAGHGSSGSGGTRPTVGQLWPRSS